MDNISKTISSPLFSREGLGVSYVTGASLVEIGTASFADPSAARKISDGLKKYCLRNGIANVSELIGVLGE